MRKGILPNKCTKILQGTAPVPAGFIRHQCKVDSLFSRICRFPATDGGGGNDVSIGSEPGGDGATSVEPPSAVAAREKELGNQSFKVRVRVAL